MEKKQSADLSDLLTQLKITNRLLVVQLKDKLKQNKLVALLESTGATNQEIADILDTTPGVIAVTVNRLKKKTKEKK